MVSKPTRRLLILWVISQPSIASTLILHPCFCELQTHSDTLWLFWAHVLVVALEKQTVGWSQKCKRCIGGNACEIRSLIWVHMNEGEGVQEDGGHLWEVWPQGQLQCIVRPSWAEVPDPRALLGSALAWELQGGAWSDSGASMDPRYCSWSLV